MGKLDNFVLYYCPEHVRGQIVNMSIEPAEHGVYDVHYWRANFEKCLIRIEKDSLYQYSNDAVCKYYLQSFCNELNLIANSFWTVGKS